MENNSVIDINDPEIFHQIKVNIEKELSNMKKIVDNVNQMRGKMLVYLHVTYFRQ